MTEATKMSKEDLQIFMKKNQKNPVIMAYTEGGGAFCFAGAFTLEQLCFLKEVMNRKIDFMLDQAIKTGVEIQPKGPLTKKGGKVQTKVNKRF